MATFYVLPPRPFVGECYASYLRTLFPGLEWARPAWPRLADTLTEAAAQEGVYVVHREELPEDEEVDQALADGFGAEAGDEVVEVRAGLRPGQFTACRRQLGRAA
jgi:hypothetical protein